MRGIRIRCERVNKRDLVGSLITGLVAALSLYWSFGAASLPHALICVIMFLAVLTLSCAYAMRPSSSKITAASLALGTLYGLLLTVGRQLDETSQIGWNVNTLLRIIAWAALLFSVLRLVLQRTTWGQPEKRVGSQPASQGALPALSAKARALAIGAIILPQVFLFLVAFPGVYGYDAGFHILQFTSGKIVRSYSVLYTLFLGGFVSLGLGLGDTAVGFALAMSLQAAFLSWVSWRACSFVFEWTRRTWAFLLSAAFLGLHPFLLIMRISSSQDALFGGFFLLLVMSLMRLEALAASGDAPVFRDYIPAIAWSMLMMLMRNNGPYAYIFILFVVPIALPRGCRLRSAALLCIPLLAYFAITGPAYSLAGVGQGNPAIREMSSIPSQQMARVYTEGGGQTLSDSDREKLLYFYDGYEFENYEGFLEISDSQKGRLNVERVLSDPIGYLSLYVSLGMHDSEDYIEAFMLNNLGFYYPAKHHGDSRMYHPYIEYQMMDATYWNPDYTDVERKSLFPSIDEWIVSMVDQNRYSGAEDAERYGSYLPFCLLVNCGTYFFLYLLALTFSIVERRTHNALALAFLGGFIVTLLLSPVCLFRYVFPLVSCTPLVLVMLTPPLVARNHGGDSSKRASGTRGKHFRA